MHVLSNAMYFIHNGSSGKKIDRSGLVGLVKAVVNM